MKTIKYILSILILIAIVSCSSKRDITHQYLKENPLFLAEQCAINFPTTIKYVEGETKTDTIVKTLPGVEIPCPETVDESGNKYTPKVKCPDEKIIETIITRVDTVYVENTANILRLKQENIELSEKAKSLEAENKSLKSKQTWMYLIIGLLTVAIIGVYKIN